MKPLVHVWEPVRRSKCVVTRKHGGWIGAGEVYGAVDNRVALCAKILPLEAFSCNKPC
jgi:hypothetical protein